jgi:hypothetical protein
MSGDQGRLISAGATTDDDHGRISFFHKTYPTIQLAKG